MRVHRSVIAIGLALTFCFAPRHAEAQPFGFLHWQGGSGDLLDANWHWEQQDADDEAPIDGDELNIGADGEVSFSGTFNPWVFRVGHPFPEGRPDLHGPGSYTQTGGSVTVSHHAAFGVEHAGNVELSGDASFTVLPPGAGGADNGTLHVGLNSVEPTTMVVKDNASVTAGFLPIGQFAQDPEAVPTAPSFLEIHDNASVTLTDNDRVIIGWFGNPETGNQAEGTLTMTGGTLTLQAAEGRPDFVIPDLVVGWDGIGTVNMSGGVIDVANSIVTAIAGADGARPRSQATINHSGGTINAARMLLSERGDTEYNFSGGEINLDFRLVLGVLAPEGVTSDATFTQSGGTVNTDTTGGAFLDVSLLIGERGQGTYNLEDGVLNVPQTLWMGEWETSTADLNISGGELNVGFDFGVSLRGEARVTQTGGVVTVGNSLLIADNNPALEDPDIGLGPSGSGVYEISGGQLHVTNDLVVGLFNGDGRLDVIGADGQVTIENNYFQDPNGHLFVQPDASGLLSLIDVAGDALFHDGTTLEANFDEYPGFSDGDFWDVLTAASITDDGINLVAPLGVEHRIVSGGNGEILQLFVGDVAVLPGDFNEDGIVDAADYTVWRDGLGTDFTQDDYLDWRANFGSTLPGAGAGTLAAVPEPSSLALLTLAMAAIVLRASRRMAARSPARPT